MADEHLSRFEQLVLPHLDAAYTLARYLLRDEHDAQDVVQDAALRAFRHFDSFRNGDPRAWFLVIVRNCCMTWKRRHRHDRAAVPYVEELHPSAGESKDTDAAAIQQSERAAVARIIAAMPVEFQEVVVMRELQGMSYAEISSVVGVPIGTVMSRLSRGRKRLAAALGLGAPEENRHAVQ
jgi:RNA polymerase sigma-70 factor (ECF subfamily)